MKLLKEFCKNINNIAFLSVEKRSFFPDFGCAEFVLKYQIVQHSEISFLPFPQTDYIRVQLNHDMDY